MTTRPADAALRPLPGPALRASRRSRVPLLAAAAALGLALLSGCSDGYPSDDLALVSPFDMDNDARIAALNDIGRHAHPVRRWRFALTDDCELMVTRRAKGDREERQVMPLRRSMDARVNFDRTDQTYGVRLVEWLEGIGDPQPLLTIVESPGWTDARSAEQLLQLVIRDCALPQEAS